VRILFDQGTPVPLRQSLTHHEVTTAYEREWSRMKYQENLKSRRVAIVVLSMPSWPRIQLAIAAVVGAVDAASTGILEYLSRGDTEISRS
jgi:hypothetical protein